MSTPLTVECDFHLGRRGRHKLVEAGPEPAPLEPGRVPRVSRLMALAIRLADLIGLGEVENYAEVAALGHVTRARVSQIMNLLNLAPDVQEAILDLPRTERGHDTIILAALQPIASTPDWRKQRKSWAELLRATALDCRTKSG
jgi:hypothetical protein